MIYALTSPGEPGPVRAPTSVSVWNGHDVSSFEFTGRLRCDADAASPVRDMCVIFHYRDPAHFYYVHFAGSSDAVHNIIGIVDGADRVKINAEPAGASDFPPDRPCLAHLQSDLRRPDRRYPGLPRRHDLSRPDRARQTDRARPRRRRLVRRHGRLRRPEVTGEVEISRSGPLFKQGGHRNILIEIGPVDPDPASDQTPVLPFRRSGLPESGEPTQGHADDPPILQLDVHHLAVEFHAPRRDMFLFSR